ncbi:VanZ family protein [Saccharicrinis sp. FJH2]|uniref:VanZ family protein n=1 Tax=Saccharicrinis sp. FJH65 TaxID=3344659 RepID=UPI0035F287DC
MRQFFKTYWRSLLWFSVITFASLVNKIPLEAPETGKIGIDKLVHFMFYFSLSFVIFIDGYRFRPEKARWYVILLFPIIWGGLIELMQSALTSGRSAEWGDFVADALGSLIVWFVIIPVYRNRAESE